MKIVHFSDIHGKLDRLSEIDFSSVDLIINTGDFFPNASRGDGEREIRYQKNWFGRKRKKLLAMFGKTPLVSVPGNHDWHDLGRLLHLFGKENAYTATPSGIYVKEVNLEFAGFGDIPFMYGEWNRERSDQELKLLVDEVFETSPDILVTHAPPAGILDEEPDCTVKVSIGYLTSALSYQEHSIMAHFFGHVHPCGGQEKNEMGIKFYNGATCAKVISW